MHELSIAAEIITSVEQVISSRKLKNISVVGLRLGALSGIDPDALSFGFQAGTIDTPLDGMTLDIEWLPIRGRCRLCWKAFEVKEYIFACPYCACSDLEITQGEELEITHLVTE